MDRTRAHARAYLFSIYTYKGERVTINIYGNEAPGPGACMHWDSPDVHVYVPLTVYMYVEQRLQWYGETGGEWKTRRRKAGAYLRDTQTRSPSYLGELPPFN